MRLRIARWFCPDTHVLAPKEPTRNMLKAAAKAMSPSERRGKPWVSVNKKHKIRYQYMIAALREGQADDST